MTLQSLKTSFSPLARLSFATLPLPDWKLYRIAEDGSDTVHADGRRPSERSPHNRLFHEDRERSSCEADRDALADGLAWYQPTIREIRDTSTIGVFEIDGEEGDIDKMASRDWMSTSRRSLPVQRCPRLRNGQ